MRWEEIRQRLPNEWLLVEALKAHTENGKRIVEDLSVVDVYADSPSAWDAYTELHQVDPFREYYVLHTSREKLDIEHRSGVGVRGPRSTTSAPSRTWCTCCRSNPTAASSAWRRWLVGCRW